MPGKRLRPFLRTSSKSQLAQSSGYESLPPAEAGVKYVLGAPQRVVFGFNVGSENSNKPHLDACKSPRSVLEPDSLSDPGHHYHRQRSPRSPRSALDSLLSSGPEADPPCKDMVGVGIGAEDVRETAHEVSVKSKPIPITEQSSCVRPQEDAFMRAGRTSTYHVNVFGDVDYGEDDEEDDSFAGAHEPIFSAASPFSNCCSLDLPAGRDFLSACFFCKCHLIPGKDIFMYRGDRAFCSTECRYQQIAIDELEKRNSAAANRYPVASPHRADY